MDTPADSLADSLDAPASPDSTTGRRYCDLGTWRLDPIYGEHRGYLIRLLCEDHHIHYAALMPTYDEARAAMIAWRADLFGELLPGAGWTIEDRARHLLILPDGRHWPLKESPE